jgi:hypothetical protein
VNVKRDRRQFLKLVGLGGVEFASGLLAYRGLGFREVAAELQKQSFVIAEYQGLGQCD